MTSRSAIEHVESGPRLSSTVIHKGIVYTAGIVCEVGGEGKDMRRENFPSVLAHSPIEMVAGRRTDHAVWTV